MYALFGAALLFLVVAWRTHWLWLEAKRLCRANPRIPPVYAIWPGQYVLVWLKAMAFGTLIVIMSVLGHVFLDHRFGLVIFSICFFPMWLWAFATSWAGILRNSVRNTQEILLAPSPPAFIAYLRDRLEEQREEVSGMPGQEWSSPVQRGIRRLSQSIPDRYLFGFWDPLDKRTGLYFSPLISTDEQWRQDVKVLCQRASAIVLDISHLSTSLAWEAELILGNGHLAGKTLLLRAKGDEALPDAFSALELAVRWVVQFESRKKDGDSWEKLSLPCDFVSIVNGCGHQIVEVR